MGVGREMEVRLALVLSTKNNPMGFLPLDVYDTFSYIVELHVKTS